MAQKVRVGVLGCGEIAYWVHLPTLGRMSEVELVSAAEPDPRAREQAASILQKPVLDRGEDLFARADIDAVVICAPTAFHYPLALAACAAHKHLYLEKPIAADLNSAREIVRAAADTGLVAMIGFHRRQHPAIVQARKILASGALGNISVAQTVLSEPMGSGAAEWRKHRASGGGVLLDLASHHFDLLRFLLHDEFAEAEARTASEQTECDAARVRMTTTRGIEVQSFFSCRSGLADTIQLFGERGTLKIDRFSPSVELRVPRRFGYGLRSAHLLRSRDAMRWRISKLMRPSYDPAYRRALEAFVARIQGQPREVPRLDDGLRSLEAVLAAEQSAQSGHAVTITAR